MTKRCWILLLIGFTVAAGSWSEAEANDFYKAKTINFIVGYTPGGGYDTYTRVIARHIGKHIPGNPAAVVLNRPGAGSLVAANYMFTKARRNGLTVGIWNSVFVLYQALGDRRVKLDSRKIGWVGAPSRGTPTCAVMGFTGLKTFTDVLNSKKPIKMGASGGTTLDVPRILNIALGRPIFDVIPGFKGTSTIRIALQAKEVDGICFEWESMKVTARSLLDATGDDKLIPVVIQRRLNDAEIQGVPSIPEVIKNEDQLATYNAWAATREFMRPFSVPPGVPEERLEILRKGFKATLQDPEFLAEAGKSKLLVEYISPDEIHTLVDRILSMPPKAKENLQFLISKNKA